MGHNEYGQLGTDTTVAVSYYPVQVQGLAGIRQINAGSESVIAITSDNKVITRGRNDYGQLGSGATCDQPTGTNCFSRAPDNVPVTNAVSVHRPRPTAARSVRTAPCGPGAPRRQAHSATAPTATVSRPRRYN
ncbi:MAG TPA: hypothetical protein VM677_16050 [Actinokineospora sp.]|nr:hypothetical protein [Actinokineospora sp.]